MSHNYEKHNEYGNGVYRLGFASAERRRDLRRQWRGKARRKGRSNRGQEGVEYGIGSHFPIVVASGSGREQRPKEQEDRV